MGCCYSVHLPKQPIQLFEPSKVKSINGISYYILQRREEKLLPKVQKRFETLLNDSITNQHQEQPPDSKQLVGEYAVNDGHCIVLPQHSTAELIHDDSQKATMSPQNAEKCIYSPFIWTTLVSTYVTEKAGKVKREVSNVKIVVQEKGKDDKL